MLLRADVERNAVRDEPAPMREFEDVRRVIRLAAEFARERPFGARAVAMDAADHAAAGRRARDLLHLRLAVDREQAHAERVGGGDFALLLDRVAVGDAVGRAAGREHGLRLADRGHVEARAEIGEQLQDRRLRIGLHGIEHARVRQRLGESQIILADDVEIDDEAGSLVAALLQEFADACGHLRISPRHRPCGRCENSERRSSACADSVAR